MKDHTPRMFWRKLNIFFTYRVVTEFEEKIKKSEIAKEKAEKSKEDTIQSMNDKIKTLKETHAEEEQKLKTEHAKLVSETDLLKEKVSNLETTSSTKAEKSEQILVQLGMISFKKSEVTIFGHKSIMQKFHHKLNIEKKIYWFKCKYSIYF